MTTMLDRFRLDDKVAIVTGASSRLGVAFAKALAEAGADLVLAARRAERLEATREVIERTGRRVITVAADVAVPENVEAVTEAAMKEFGRVDVLVNNAGKGRRRRRHDTAENRPAPAVKISAAPASLPAGDALELPGRARLVLRRS